MTTSSTSRPHFVNPRLALLGLLLGAGVLQAQVGPVLWQEDFNDLENWIAETGNGSWGWGNGELQYYSPDNAEVVELADDPGNMALRITARQESGPGIVDQWGNALNYTSARLNTKSKVSIRHGLVEARVKVPDLNVGGWPALWMLGTSTLGWPRCGELDIMEMGHDSYFRYLHDGHNGGEGNDTATVNEMVAANAIFYSDDAVTPENPSGGNSIAWDPDDDYCRPYYNQSEGLTNRWLTYRLYWDEAELRFTVTDEGTEYDLYESPFPTDSTSAEFQEPFYLICNLAVGGALTDAYNLGDPGSGQPVSMSFPAEMYVDYIRVSQWNGQGEVTLGPPVQVSESLGLFTETTETTETLELGTAAEIYVWEGTLIEADIEPYEGDNVLAWQNAGMGWFGAGIMSMQPTNLFGFADGHLNFNILIPADVTFKIGIIDAWGNQNYVEFPANTTVFGLERNGQWGQAVIPIETLRGQYMDLRMLSYEFVVLEEHGANCQFALDNIYYDGGETGVSPQPGTLAEDFGLTGVYPNPFNPSTTVKYQLPASAQVQVGVYDLQGRLVSELLNERQPAGQHQLNWNAGNAASGVYFIQMQAGQLRDTRKCLLVR